jgi:hypothetical protein
VISQLFFGIAGHPLETLVRRQIPSALEIKGCDADQGGLEHRSPTLLALSERFHGALALRNEKGRQPDYRDADKCLEARSRWLGHTWQKEGQKRETAQPTPTNTTPRALRKNAANSSPPAFSRPHFWPCRTPFR